MYRNIQNSSTYLTVNTRARLYEGQSVNIVWRSSWCLLWESFGTPKCIVWRKC